MSEEIFKHVEEWEGPDRNYPPQLPDHIKEKIKYLSDKGYSMEMKQTQSTRYSQGKRFNRRITRVLRSEEKIYMPKEGVE